MNSNPLQTDFEWQKWLMRVAAACLALGLLDFLPKGDQHVMFEGWFNFFGFFAAAVTLVTILLAIVAGSFLQRKEDYYDG